MVNLNFSWVISDRLAGCEGPHGSGDLSFLRQQGITVLVRVAESYMAEVTREQVEASGLQDFHYPIGDFVAPSQESIHKVVNYVKRSINDGEVVAVSCGAGIGRTGMILACVLISIGYTVEDALDTIRRTRKHKAWETDEQYQAILDFANKIEKM